MSVPFKLNGKHLYQIMLTLPEIVDLAQKIGKAESEWTDEDINALSVDLGLYPTSVVLTSETYSRNTSRTANYELENIQIVNRKAKPEFTWDIIKAQYVASLMRELSYTYGFKNSSGDIVPQDSPILTVTYQDFVGMRTINAYLGQTIDGTLEKYNDNLYWRGFRIAFPER